MKLYNYAIILAGGVGKRMGLDIPKQYALIENKPLLYYTIKAFFESKDIDRIILVTRKEDIDFCTKEFVEKYNFDKITEIVAGGNERYESVYNGIIAIPDDCRYVYIHDGARPCVSQEVIHRLTDEVAIYKNAIAAVRAKDTVRIADDNGNCINTPNRDNVWNIQTPQVFEYTLIREAYDAMNANPTSGITDDAMVAERYIDMKIHLTESDYSNIKVTTSEDLSVVTENLKKFQKLVDI